MVYPTLPMLAVMAMVCAAATLNQHISRYSTHRVRSIGSSGIKFATYHPPTTFETYGVGIDHPLSKRGIMNVTSSNAARSFLENTLGLASHHIAKRSGHEFDGVSHEYFHQIINGIPVANAVANVAVKDNKIVSFGSSFVTPARITSKRSILTEQDAILMAEKAIGGAHNNWPTSLEYFIGDDGRAFLAHVVQIQNKQTSEWYEVFVNANNGNIINVIDLVAHMSYRAVPFNLQNPTQGYRLIVNPEDLVASPSGWHHVGSIITTTLSGNNAVCSGNPMQSSLDTFDYPYDFTLTPSQGNNPNAGRVNAFYVVNTCHDSTYRYGFTESSFNFQLNNSAKGGAANDRVIISIQDAAAGTNGDSFATPPDGQSPIMRTAVWTYTPRRDQALENDLLTHEYGHGVSNRLTGGGTARCLQTTEASGMGEGWSDMLTEISELNSTIAQDFTLGSWLVNQPGGIRSYPYSTNIQVNPLTYGSLATLNEVHAIGEVWATMWHEVIAALLAKYGFSSDWRNTSGTAGNIVVMHLYIDSLKLQPCNPTFITARNAMIQADVNRYSGVNKCLLWKAFAKRGLGSGATATKANNVDLPADCA